MATNITQYYMSRISPYTMAVTIFDTNEYAAFQVYADNSFQKTSLTKTFVINQLPNQKVDILGVATLEVSTDFSNNLSDSNGDKIEFYLDGEYLGDDLYIYWDNGTGTIDYTSPLATIDTTHLPIVNSFDDFLGWTTQDFIQMTTPHFNLFATFDEYGAIRLVLTGRVLSNTYKFGIAAHNHFGNGPELDESIQIKTTPNEITPEIVSYNPTSDKLLIDTGSTDSGSTFTLYAGSNNGDKSTVLGGSTWTSTNPNMEAIGVRGGITNGSRWILVRETNSNGLQEKNWSWMQFVIVNGDWAGNVPSTPTNLKGTLGDGNILTLSWSYYGSVVPDGFHVFGGNPINYLTPVLTWTGGNRQVYLMTLHLTSASSFAVQAYKGGKYSPVSNSVFVSPDTKPQAVYGELRSTWKDK